MDLYYYLIQVSFSILVFVILFVLTKFLIDRLKGSSIKFLNPTAYLPEEQIKTLKQVYYLIMAMLLFLSIMNFFFDNNIILSNNPEFYFFNSVLDIIVSVYIATVIYDKSSKKSLILIFFLMPIASVSYIISGASYLEYWDFLRIPAFLYLIKYFYDRFMDYTDEHALSFSIILLFTILIISIVITIFIENENPLNAIVMVSNAFTSNGYAILGDTPGGKINSIILVWSGYILSGAATATLTVAIFARHYHDRFNSYDEKLDEMKKMIEELKNE